MKRVDRRHDIVVARKLVEPAIVIQVSYDEPSRYAIPLIYGSADRREEWVSIDAVDLRLRVDLPDSSAHIAGATTEIQRANGWPREKVSPTRLARGLWASRRLARPTTTPAIRRCGY